MAVQEQRFASYFCKYCLPFGSFTPHNCAGNIGSTIQTAVRGGAFFASVIAAGKLVVSIHFENGYIINEEQITLVL